MENDTDLCSVNYHANKLSEAAIVAFWVDDLSSRNHHMNQMRDAFDKLTELMRKYYGEGEK